MENKSNLKRELGLAAATSIVVGNMIGSGIFTSPQSLAQVANPKITVTCMGHYRYWFIIISLIICKSWNKISVQQEAQLFILIRHLVSLWAFLVSWTFWLGSWIGNAAIITAVMRYLTTFIPALGTNGMLAFAVSSALLWLFTYINYRGVKNAGYVSIVTTVIKIGVILVFMFIALTGFDAGNLQTAATVEANSWGALPAAIAITLWSFVGLESAAISGGEIKNPEKNIRKSTVMGTLLAVLIYIFLSVLAMGSMPQSMLAQTQAPLADIINHITGATWGGYFISGGIVISAIGALSGWVLTTARLAYAAGEDNLFPKFFAKVHPKFKTPHIALIITSLCTNALLMLNYVSNLTEAFDFMINLATLSFIPAYALTACAEIVLTFKKEHKLTVVSFLKHGFLSLIAFVYAIYIIYGAGSESAMWVFILMLIGIPFYVYKKLQNNEEFEA